MNMGYGACNDLSSHTSATHLLLVHSQSEYNFTSNDLEWLEYYSHMKRIMVKSYFLLR